MEQNIKIINTAKTLKGTHIKAHRSHQKISRHYTEIIQQDDYYFHNIKVQGQCAQISDNRQKQRQKLSPKRSGHSQKTYKDHHANFKTKGVPGWTSKTNLFVSKGSIKPSAGFIRSITTDTATNLDKSHAETKYNRKFTRTQTTMNQEDYPRIIYRQQNLNQQIYCSFKNILDEFNRVAEKRKPVIEDKSKLEIKLEDKSFRKTYKKPNFYNYQQFYRQNYQAKHLQQSPFLFKKCEYAPVQDKSAHKQKQNVRPVQKNEITKKTDKVCVCIDSRRMQIKNKYSEGHELNSMDSCLRGSGSKNKTHRSRYQKQPLNKTQNNFMVNSSCQSDRIEPWKATDHYQIWF